MRARCSLSLTRTPAALLISMSERCWLWSGWYCFVIGGECYNFTNSYQCCVIIVIIFFTGMCTPQVSTAWELQGKRWFSVISWEIVEIYSQGKRLIFSSFSSLAGSSQLLTRTVAAPSMWMNSSNPICWRGNLKCLHQCFSFPYQQTWPTNIPEILWKKISSGIWWSASSSSLDSRTTRTTWSSAFKRSGGWRRMLQWEKRDCMCFDFARNAVDVDGDGQITKEEFVEKGLRAISIF